MVCLALGFVGILILLADVVVGDAAPIIVGALGAAIVGGLWFVLPPRAPRGRRSLGRLAAPEGIGRGASAGRSVLSVCARGCPGRVPGFARAVHISRRADYREVTADRRRSAFAAPASRRSPRAIARRENGAGCLSAGPRTRATQPLPPSRSARTDDLVPGLRRPDRPAARRHPPAPRTALRTRDRQSRRSACPQDKPRPAGRRDSQRAEPDLRPGAHPPPARPRRGRGRDDLTGLVALSSGRGPTISRS